MGNWSSDSVANSTTSRHTSARSRASNYCLGGFGLDDSNPEFTSLTFSFTGPPRLFVLENPHDRTVRLRFADTAPGDSFTLTPYEDGRVRVDDLTTDPNQVFVTLSQIASDFKLEKDELSDPARWVIRIYGQPIFQDIAIEEEDSSLTPDEAAKLDRERRVATQRLGPLISKVRVISAKVNTTWPSSSFRRRMPQKKMALVNLRMNGIHWPSSLCLGLRIQSTPNWKDVEEETIIKRLMIIQQPSEWRIRQKLPKT